MNGNTQEYTQSDIRRIAKQYNEQAENEKHYAPIVVGHPATNAPAYGWIKKLHVKGGDLYAEPERVNPEFKKMVNSGAYRTRSAAFYADGKLRHVGFLGACPPAIKGLEDFAFAEGEDFAVYTMERLQNGKNRASARILRRIKTLLAKIPDVTAESIESAVPDYEIDQIGDEMKIEELKKENERLRSENIAYSEKIKTLEERMETLEQKQKEAFFAEFKAKLVGKMPQVDQDKTIAIAERLYNEGGVDGVKDFVDVVDKMPVSIPQEKDIATDGIGKEYSEYDEYEEYAEVDEDRKKLNAKAKKIAKEKNLPYPQALEIAMKESK
jgi:FtsZ-binding cell division protein ZapB